MSKVSKIDQIHLRDVMLCMSKMSKTRSNTPKAVMLVYVEDVEDGKRTYSDTLLSIPFLNVILCPVEDVEDRSNTPNGCNAMYVEDVESWEKNIHTHFGS